jgi:hypothetical protein
VEHAVDLVALHGLGTTGFPMGRKYSDSYFALLKNLNITCKWKKIIQIRNKKLRAKNAGRKKNIDVHPKTDK